MCETNNEDKRQIYVCIFLWLIEKYYAFYFNHDGPFSMSHIFQRIRGSLVLNKDITRWNEEVKTVIKKKKNAIMHQENAKMRKTQPSIRKSKLRKKQQFALAKLKAFAEKDRKKKDIQDDKEKTSKNYCYRRSKVY